MAKETVESLTRRVNSFVDPFQLRYFVGINLEFIHVNYDEVCDALFDKVKDLRSSWARMDGFYNKMLDGLLEDIEALEISPGRVKPKPSSYVMKAPPFKEPKEEEEEIEVRPANPVDKIYRKPKITIPIEKNFNPVKPSEYLSIEVKRFNANLIEEARRELVRIALRSTYNDQKKAAKALGVTPRTLEYWLKDLKEQDGL